MNARSMLFAAMLGILTCRAAMSSDIVVIGRLVSDEPMRYVKEKCLDAPLCFHGWYKNVIQVDRTLQGKHLSGRITAAAAQHNGVNARFKRAVRLFVLSTIESPAERAKLRADYYLEDAAEPEQMFCLSQDPKGLGLNVEASYVRGSGDSATYCFRLPGS